MSDPIQTNNSTLTPGSGTSLKSGKTKVKTPSTMVSVVEEQSNDDDVIHLPLAAPSAIRSITASVPMNESVSTNTMHEIISDKNDKLDKPFDVGQSKLITSVSEDMKNPSLKLDKKSADLLSANLANINEMKLKKTTNPSISSLRAMSIQASYPTTSSASTTLTKASTRAEYFAAKLHDAIKNDTKNQNDTVETFVYDTTATATPPIPEQDGESIGGKLLGENVTRDNASDHNTERHTTNEESPFSNQMSDEYFDVRSKSSGNSKHTRKRASKIFNEMNSFSELRPSKGEKSNNTKMDGDKVDKPEPDNKSVNQLRQITSRLFDNKVLQQRRQSEVDNDFADDSFEEDLDYYEPSLSNITSNQDNYISNFNYKRQMNTRNNSNGNNANPIDYGMGIDDLDYEDDVSDFFSSNYHSLNNQNCKHTMNNSYINKSLLNGSNGFPDYGSVDADKRKWKRSLYHNSPHDFTSVRAQRIRQIRSFCYSMSLIILLLFIGFISGFVLATNKELQGLRVVDTHNTLVSQEELVFDMLLSAFNPGLMSISIETVQLDIFAKTQFIYHAYEDDVAEVDSAYDTVLLGSIDVLEVPLYFEGGFLNRKRDTSETQIKIVNPCSFESQDPNDYSDVLNDVVNVEKSVSPIVFAPDPRWLNISRHPFDLIIRGAMMYKLPFSGLNHTVSVSYTSYVDPGDDSSW